MKNVVLGKNYIFFKHSGLLIYMLNREIVNKGTRDYKVFPKWENWASVHFSDKECFLCDEALFSFQLATAPIF